MVREIRREFVDHPREFEPCTLNVECQRLTAEFAVTLWLVSRQDVEEVNKTIPFRADLLRDPGDLLCELTQFIDHGIDGVLELDYDYALRDDNDFLAEITPCDCIADSRDVRYQVLERLQLLNLFSKTLQLLPL